MFKLEEQPQTIGQIIANSVELLKQIFTTIVPVVVVVELVLILSQALSKPVISVGGLLFPPLFSLSFFTLLIFYALKVVSVVFILLVAHDCSAGRELSIETSLKAVIPKLLPIFLASLLFVAGIIIGLSLFILPSLFFALFFFCYLPAITLDDFSPIDAFKCSLELVWENLIRALGIFAVVSLVMLAVDVVGGLLISILPGFIRALLNWVLYTLIGTFLPCVLYVFYNDLKLRAQLKPAQASAAKHADTDTPKE